MTHDELVKFADKCTDMCNGEPGPALVVWDCSGVPRKTWLDELGSMYRGKYADERIIGTYDHRASPAQIMDDVKHWMGKR